MHTSLDTPTTALDPQLMAVKQCLPPAGGPPPIKTLVMTTQAPLYQQLRNLLARQHYQVDWQREPLSPCAEVPLHTYDLLVLGPTLDPDTDLQQCAQVRRRTRAPLLLLTDAYSMRAFVQAIELGADRMLPLPFDAQALTAHISALLRRSHWERTLTQPQVLCVGPICLDPATHTVQVNGQPIILSVRYYGLLHYLMQHVNRPVSKAELRRALWADQANSNAIEVAIRRLRHKIEANPSQPQYLVTQYGGTGYQLRQP